MFPWQKPWLGTFPRFGHVGHMWCFDLVRLTLWLPMEYAHLIHVSGVHVCAGLGHLCGFCGDSLKGDLIPDLLYMLA